MIKRFKNIIIIVTKESIERAVAGEPKAKDVVSEKDPAEHPFAAK